MQTININLIVKHQDSGQWKNAEQHELPAVPRIGEFVALGMHADKTSSMYRVVGVFHFAPFHGVTEVFAVYDGTLLEVQDRLLTS